MNRFAFWGALLLLTAAGCGGGDESSTTGPRLSVRIEPKQLSNNGAEATVTVKAYNEDNTPGVGDVTLSAAAGLLDGSPDELVLELEDGEATATFTCNAEEDENCVGDVRITGLWGEVMGRTTVELPPADAGMSQTEGGPANGFAVTVTANPTTAYLDLTEVALAIQVKETLGNVGAPLAVVKIRTTLGTLTGSGDLQGKTLTETADGEGRVNVTLTPDAEDETPTGTATVTVEHLSSKASATVNVAFRQISQITYVNNMCDGKACTIMGKEGTGYNEQSLMKFKVTEPGNKAAVGVPVTFTLSENFPAGTEITDDGVTDAKGEVTTTISTGRSIGTFTVKATVKEGSVEATSVSVGIRGAKASNQGFDFSCGTINMPAYVSNTPPAVYMSTCDFRLVDTTNNPVGTGTPVYFKAEAGSIANSVNSGAFSTANLAAEGRGSVTFSTQGTWPPFDTEPFDADPGQFPAPLAEEPRYDDGPLTRNPRDGVITIIAYLRGEEFYDDNNANGTWDVGERFYDMGEAFVDSNDNNQWDVGEFLVDDSPSNGVWDPPNGVWDGNTTIWSEAKVVVSSRSSTAAASISPANFSGGCGSGTELGKLETVTLVAYHPDINLNRVASANSASSVTVTDTATKGSWAVLANHISQDGYGFDIEWRWVDASLTANCTPASTRCVRRTIFGGWSRGRSATVELTGAALADMTACQANQVRVRVTTLTQSADAFSNGAIE